MAGDGDLTVAAGRQGDEEISCWFQAVESGSGSGGSKYKPGWRQGRSHELGRRGRNSRTLDGKKSGLRETNKTQSGANDKVWQLNENTEKPLALLATFYERFQASNRDICDMENRFDGEFDQVEVLTKKAAGAQKVLDQAMAQLSRTRNSYRTSAAAFDEAENDLNHGLRNLHQWWNLRQRQRELFHAAPETS